MYALTCYDILDFAWLALIVTGLFRLLKLKSIYILLIGIVLSIVGSFIAFEVHSNWTIDYLLGYFFVTTKDESCFVFFNWYIFVSAGLVFSEVLKRIENEDKLYKNILIVSSIILITYVVLTIVFGFYFLTKLNYYYACSILEAIGLLSIDMFLLSVFYFLLKKKDDDKEYWYTKVSKNLTVIYFIHWCIIGFIDSIFGYLMEIIFLYYVLFIMGIVIIFLSIFLSDVYRKIRRRKSLK